MINVVFSEPAAGMMKLNQEKGLIDASDEILCLGFMLEQGDISQKADSKYRRDYILDMYMQSGYLTDPEDIEELKESISSYCRDLERVVEAARNGEEIRVWNEISPASISGFYHLCSVLDPYDVGFEYIEIPHNFIDLGDPTSDLMENAIYDHLEDLKKLQTSVSYLDVNYYSLFWEQLAEENAPLRAMVNGQLISVPEDIFDFIILKHLTTPKQEHAVIGEILISDQRYLSDTWLAKRIQKLIDKGKIVILEDNSVPYQRTIIRADD